jgi:hypothetical protein
MTMESVKMVRQHDAVAYFQANEAVNGCRNRCRSRLLSHSPLNRRFVVASPISAPVRPLSFSRLRLNAHSAHAVKH